jgi:hypothetical protein
MNYQIIEEEIYLKKTLESWQYELVKAIANEGFD